MINHRVSGEAVTHVEESKTGKECGKEREKISFERQTPRHGNKNPPWGARELRKEKYSGRRNNARVYYVLKVP